MDIEIVRDPTALSALEADWVRLAERRGDAFLTPDWFLAAQAELGESSPLVIVGRRGGSVKAVLPLTVSGRLRVAGFPGATLGDRFGVLAAGEDEAEFAAGAGEALMGDGGVRMAILRHVDQGERWSHELRHGSARKLAAVEQRFADEPFIPLEGQTWEDYLGSRSSKFRKRVRYLERSLGKDPGFEVRDADPLRADAEMDVFFHLHDLRWSGGAESSIADPGTRAFLRSFAVRAAARGWLRLRFLEVGGSPVAALLGWRVGGRFAFYQAGFDPSFAKRSVGMLLVALTIRQAITEGAAEFDFLLGDEDYKWRFASEKRTVRTITLVPAGSPLRAFVAGEAWARKHGRFLAQNPATRRLLQRMSPTSRA